MEEAAEAVEGAAQEITNKNTLIMTKVLATRIRAKEAETIPIRRVATRRDPKVVEAEEAVEEASIKGKTVALIITSSRRISTPGTTLSRAQGMPR